MRIIAGSAGGRRLQAPPGDKTRPTSDRAREALFSRLTALRDLAGAVVLDLYAGTGALGLEALSRGATRADLVESVPAVARLARANAEALGLVEATVHPVTVERFLAALAATPTYDVVFADPPYALPVQRLSAQLDTLRPALRPGAVVVVERSSREPDWVWPEPLTGLRVGRYGAAALWYGRAP